MKSTRLKHGKSASAMVWTACVVLAAAASLGFHTAKAQISQTPLYLGGGNVPGNLLLVPSVEWPTIVSVANLGDYNESTKYIGYFDADKCYNYLYSTTEADRHFQPVGWATNHRCNHQWSGNFMNWAATQTIDPFRLVLTGGYRVKDTATDTWLEKARHTGQGGTNIYPNRTVTGLSVVQGATPFDATSIELRIEGLGNRMRFRLEGDVAASGVDVHDYNPADAYWATADAWNDNSGWLDNAYDLAVRVSVCVPTLLESDCRQYSGGWKPEGLIQQYSEDLRIGVFGYLNDPHYSRDGGALRARLEFVGPKKSVPGSAAKQPNPLTEWDPATGIQLQNPDTTDASATSTVVGQPINYSGAINYLNMFGEMTNSNHKQYDPVSELYYAALRYLKHQGNVPEYTNMSGDAAARYVLADGFPVITNWEDPVNYACQKNVILGIGDVNTHRDKNLPGSTYTDDEPTMPASVAADTTVNAVTWTNRVGALEGLGSSIANTNSWSGRKNSAYMAGLAYYANTTDIRPDIPGMQTASTYWVDVLEAQKLEAPARNQYYLAAKFGGFKAPESANFDPLTRGSTPLDLGWWHTNTDTLVSGTRPNPSGTSFQRPDNYYLAGKADQMVNSLTMAFAHIAAEMRSSASSVAANSTRLGTDTTVFQAAFDSHRWSGELQAFKIDGSGAIATTASWNAASVLDGLSDSDMANRNIFTVTTPTQASPGAPFISTTGTDFTWTSLDAAQQAALSQAFGGGTPVAATVAQQRLDYLRGDRSQEQPGGAFRKRDSRLGDIVNSDPQFVYHQDFGYTLLAQSGAFTSAVASGYGTFRQTATYQNRPPLVIVGSNDGMLHGFNADLGANGGKELFAFVPASVFANLYELTLPAYSHRYFVDGSTRIADAYLGATPGWRTIAVGSTGAGGKSVFALDVTDPANMTAADVLWEFSDPDMGYTLSQPAVVPLPNGTFGVVVTSGYGNTGSDHIWILDPADGSVEHDFVLPSTSGDLGSPLVVDLNGDRAADRIYVGDSKGNLWRFDLVGSNTANWGPPTGLMSGSTQLPLFVATDAGGTPQAITAPLTSAFNEKGEHMVFFGTGSFYRINDNVVPANPSVDTFYGIIDSGTPITGRSGLLEQEILTEQIVGQTRVRGITDNTMQSGQGGWFVDLEWKTSYGGPGALGERVVSRALIRDDRVIFTTLIPDADPCSPGGQSWLMELQAFSGSRLGYSVFDVDTDNDFDSGDWITVQVNGQPVKIPASGIRPDIGIMDTPAVITDIGQNRDEIKVVSGSTGQLMKINERGSNSLGRQSWRQLR